MYRTPSNVVNFLTVGDDFGDMCLLDRHSHFTYICDTDVFCMFISKDKLIEALGNHPKELLFLQRRATMRINQTMSLRGKVVEAKSALIQKIKTQFADPKAFLLKIKRQESQRVFLDTSKQKYVPGATPTSSSQSKKLLVHQAEKESEKTVLKAKNNWVTSSGNRTIFENIQPKSLAPDQFLSAVPIGEDSSSAGNTLEKNRRMSIKAEEFNKFSTDFLLTPLDIKKKNSNATAPKLSFVDSEDHPPSKQEDIEADDNTEAIKELLMNSSAFDPLNLQRIIKSEEIEKLRVAGEAIKELEMTFTALGTGFQSKLIRSTSLDKDAQNVKYKKKEILSKVIRQSHHFKPESLQALTSKPTAPFLEDFQADSNLDKTPTKEKVRDFIFRELKATRETGKTVNRRKKIQALDLFSHKNIDRQKLLFVARMSKEHFDGSLEEESSDEPDGRVNCGHLRRGRIRHSSIESTPLYSHQKRRKSQTILTTPISSTRNIRTAMIWKTVSHC